MLVAGEPRAVAAVHAARTAIPAAELLGRRRARHPWVRVDPANTVGDTAFPNTGGEGPGATRRRPDAACSARPPGGPVCGALCRLSTVLGEAARRPARSAVRASI